MAIGKGRKRRVESGSLMGRILAQKPSGGTEMRIRNTCDGRPRDLHNFLRFLSGRCRTQLANVPFQPFSNRNVASTPSLPIGGEAIANKECKKVGCRLKKSSGIEMDTIFLRHFLTPYRGVMSELKSLTVFCPLLEDRSSAGSGEKSHWTVPWLILSEQAKLNAGIVAKARFVNCRARFREYFRGLTDCLAPPEFQIEEESRAATRHSLSQSLPTMPDIS